MNTEPTEVTQVQPVIAVAREHGRDPETPVTLSTGVSARVKAVATHLIDNATRRIKDPKVPIQFDEDKQREVENPFDPEYLAAKEEADRKRGMAAMDVMIMFGVELVDPVPALDAWVPKLEMLARLGSIDFNQDEFDLSNPLELEFVYKRYVAVSTADIQMISERSGAGVSAEDLRAAEDSFRS